MKSFLTPFQVSKSVPKILALGLAITAITFLHYADFGSNAAFHPIYRRLYYLPIILAAFHYRLRGGVAAASIVSLVYLPHVFTYWKSDVPGQMENLMEIFVFFTVGILTGLLVSREKSLSLKTVRMERFAAFGEMADMLTKDLRISLAALRGLAQSFLGKIKGEAGLDFSAQLFSEHIDRIEHRFDEIEKLACDRQLRIARCNLGQVVDRCIAQSRDDFAAQNIHYSCTGLQNLPETFMDPEKIERVIQFLMTATLLRLPEGGTLTIRAEKEFGRIVLHIAETGAVSLPPVDGRIHFTPMFENGHLDSGWYWLYVQRIIADHSGEIVWQQVSPRSSIFSLKLPVRHKLLIQPSGGSRLVAAEQF